MTQGAIVLFSLLSYYTGTKAIIQGNYRPNIFSRFIWVLLAANSLAGVILLGNNTQIITLSFVQTLGSLLILLAALRHTIYRVSLVDIISSVLLLTSGAVWLLGDVPALNVAISLVAHFIGGIPTFFSVLRDPESENVRFWGYFAIASAIAFLDADKSNVGNYMFPLYFTGFNLSIVLLAMRQRRRKKRLHHHQSDSR